MNHPKYGIKVETFAREMYNLIPEQKPGFWKKLFG
jgi:hypothetical protein